MTSLASRSFAPARDAGWSAQKAGATMASRKATTGNLAATVTAPVDVAADLDGQTSVRNTVAALVAVAANLEHGKRLDAPPSPVAQCHVTLLQMASIVNRSKRTLERIAAKPAFPLPAVEGCRGKPGEWLWRDVRPILEAEFGRNLPDVFPADRFVR
jgi:hypothetical protein